MTQTYVIMTCRLHGASQDAQPQLLEQLRSDLDRMEKEEACLHALIAERAALLARIQSLLDMMGAEGGALEEEMDLKEERLAADVKACDHAMQFVKVSAMVVQTEPEPECICTANGMVVRLI